MNASLPPAAARNPAPGELGIGEWRVSPATNQLARSGETVRLEPKVMEVLVFLAERPGQVVSREALLTALWPGMVVADDALTQAVIKLRKALGDSARSPAYIETISKRGYRLVARVEEASRDVPQPPETLPASGVEPSARISPRTSRRWIAACIGLAVAILTATVAVYLYRESEGDIVARQLSLVDRQLAQRSTSLPAIAILPFEALAQDTDQRYLAAGLTADLATDLSTLSGMRVVNNAGLAGVTPAAAEAARYFVSGTVQGASGKLKVNVRLVDSKSGQQLWAERYERSLGDPFALNEDIVTHVLEALSIRIRDAERARLAKRYTRSLDAYDYFLRGQAAYFARHQADNANAREMYLKAISLDPVFARAYAGLALTYAADYRHQWGADGRQALARAEEFAETAVRIDPQLPEACAVLGLVSSDQGKHERAIAHLTRAITLDPMYGNGYALLGAAYVRVGQAAKAVPLIRTAMRLNPEGTNLYFRELGRAYLFQGDTEQAVLNLREAVSRNSADVDTRVYMAAALAAAGDMEAARWEVEEIRALRPDFAARNWMEVRPMTDARQKERLLGLLAQVGL